MVQEVTTFLVEATALLRIGVVKGMARESLLGHGRPSIARPGDHGPEIVQC